MTDRPQQVSETEPQIRPPDRPLVYGYLTSAPHSGSTLVACLLSANDRISSVGEFGARVEPTQRCSCGSNYEDCDFWRRWAEEAQAKGLDFELGNLGVNLEAGPSDGRVADLFFHQFPWQALDKIRDAAFSFNSKWQYRWQTAVDRSVALATILRDREETDVFLDTTKNPLQIRYLARSPEISLRIISLFRDGRAVVNSLIKREKWSLETAVRSWVWCCQNQLRAARYLAPPDVFHLRLEQLCREPKQTLSAVCDFLGIPPGPEPDYSDLSTRHIIGNKMRHTFRGQIRHDESWRDELSSQSIRYFEQQAGWLNRKLGYAD